MRNFNAIKLASLLALTGCQTTPPPDQKPDPVPEVIYKTNTIDTACSWTSLIKISKDDLLTADTARQIMAHDTGYQKHCTSGLNAK